MTHMAQEHGETSAHSEGANGASLSLEAQRAATLAALEAGEHEIGAPAKPAKQDKPVESEDADEAETADDDAEEREEDEEVEASDEDEDDDRDEDVDSDDEEEDEEERETTSKDPDLAKRLAKVRKAELRSKELLSRERQTFERERDAFISEWKPRVEAAAKFEKLQGRVKYNVVEVLQELGLNLEEDGEDLARDIYAHSKKGSADPNNKAAVARMRRERELLDEVRDLKKWREEREASEKQTAEQRTVAERTQKFITGVAKLANDEQPLLKRLVGTNEDQAHAFIGQAAVELIDELGVEPSKKRVLARAEKKYRAHLKQLGVDPSLIAKAPAAAQATGKKAVETKTKKAESSNGKPMTLAERRAETLRKLEAGELDLD